MGVPMGMRPMGAPVPGQRGPPPMMRPPVGVAPNPMAADTEYAAKFA
jgi:hypothetical protein